MRFYWSVVSVNLDIQDEKSMCYQMTDRSYQVIDRSYQIQNSSLHNKSNPLPIFRSVSSHILDVRMEGKIIFSVL